VSCQHLFRSGLGDASPATLPLCPRLLRSRIYQQFLIGNLFQTALCVLGLEIHKQLFTGEMLKWVKQEHGKQEISRLKWKNHHTSCGTKNWKICHSQRIFLTKLKSYLTINTEQQKSQRWNHVAITQHRALVECMSRMAFVRVNRH